VVVGLALPTTAPPAAAARPSVTVSPRVDLVDGEPLRIAVHDWVPSTYLVAFQCAAGAPAYGNGCDYLTRLIPGPAGNVRVRRPADVIVDRRRGGPVDCRVSACELVVRDANGPHVPNNAVVRVPLDFDPGGPDPAREALDVSPSTDLQDGDEVVVSGSTFHLPAYSPAGIGPVPEGGGPAHPVYLYQCRDGHQSYLDCQNAGFDGLNGAGDFEETVEVRSRLYLANGGTVDCLADPCVLVATADGEHSRAGEVPLSFDPEGPVAPEPTVSITPSTGVLENQTVTITGEDFAPNQGVDLALCPPGAAGWTFRACHSPFDLDRPFPAADENGDVTFTHAAHPMLFYDQRADVDCRAVTCSFVITWADVDEAPSAPLAFDPVAPPAPPVLTATPTTGLVGGQEVTVDGDGYARVRETRLVQCVARATPTSGHPCGRFSRPILLAGDRRSFTTHFAVRRRIVVDQAWVNCARRPCYLATVDQENELVRGPRLRFAS
jgi:hypothetical protein